MLKRLGMAYDEAEFEYENELEKAISHDGGAELLDLNCGNLRFHLIDGSNVPDTGYGS